MEKTIYRRPAATGETRKAAAQVGSARGLFILPEDLRELVGTELLARWIQEELAELNWDHPLLADIMRRRPDYHPKELLSVLAFACATGLRGAEQITQACGGEEPYKQLCGGNVPIWQELRSFRWVNRELVALVVQRLLVRALSRKLGRNPLFVPPEIDREMRDRAFARVDLALRFDRVEG